MPDFDDCGHGLREDAQSAADGLVRCGVAACRGQGRNLGRPELSGDGRGEIPNGLGDVVLVSVRGGLTRSGGTARRCGG